MLWWFLILGASVAVIVSVATLLLVQVKRQMKHGKSATPNEANHPSSPPQA